MHLLKKREQLDTAITALMSRALRKISKKLTVEHKTSGYDADLVNAADGNNKYTKNLREAAKLY